MCVVGTIETRVDDSLPELPLGRFRVKTTPDRRPEISVYDHCVNVGCVAETPRELLPVSIREPPPPETWFRVASQGIGKITRSRLAFSPLHSISFPTTSEDMRDRKHRRGSAPAGERRIKTGGASGAPSASGHFHAHSKQRADGSPAPLAEWEPLFTPFDDASPTGCRRSDCPLCESLESHHGHLNKVAWWTAKFAGEMFAEGPDRASARQWGFIAGLWHDLGNQHPKHSQSRRQGTALSPGHPFLFRSRHLAPAPDARMLRMTPMRFTDDKIGCQKKYFQLL